MSEFEAELHAAAEQVNEALAGLTRIAKAAGIWQETWHALSITEVSEMIAAWCRARRALPRQDAGVVEYWAARRVDAGMTVEMAPFRRGLVVPLRPGGSPLGVALNPAAANEPVFIRVPLPVPGDQEAG